MERSRVLRSASALGITTSFILSGVYLSSSLLVLPILFRLPSAISADIFGEFYYRGRDLVAPLSAVATLSFATAAYSDTKNRIFYLVAASWCGAVVPWTTTMMMETIQKLIEVGSNEEVREMVGQQGTVDLLKNWQFLNTIRLTISLAGAVTGLLVNQGMLPV